uniref:26S proteasome regulatory subunit RPN2 C-terminal domain-containing protein n=4 Tax=Rhodosorus marinus TaxID=101924 RepID=A0A7S2ZZS4_9RHOD|mmetsp:Transcript_39307/g.155940  ORF Transcript_39307/g.155940 Transcript_39307/m.155940 type:complete len:1034 (+) Transcript_39307:225-3326(+)|eukprot:CAMPEP_0113968402 /NCGR_PEP_ID=MMETSP0011_2-20120614/9514_1 /TAXON_ID=101924 /ORGANISM="Rhodosorus marinus" /LENGTH=1033 /DNA_ID=CAMNT_0000981489 /DNA_START=163 /DNA_END=3264 /DNA_ORIENTATION=+ /assembly_acc=CAM_ASM_000156
MSVAVMNPIVQSSAASALLQLDEPEVILQSHALRILNSLADSFWPEISPSVAKIQDLSEKPSFPDAKLASLVAAKILFHLGDLDEALAYALRAEELFSISDATEFATTLRAKCIDEYIIMRNKPENETANDGKAQGIADDLGFEENKRMAALEDVVQKVLDSCIKNGEVRESIGVAIEAKMHDRLEQAIQSCASRDERIAALNYCFECSQSLVASRRYRAEVLKLIADMHRREEDPDEVALANCLSFLEDAERLAELLEGLVMSDDESKRLAAIQIAFNVHDNDTPRFFDKVVALFVSKEKTEGEATTEDSTRKEARQQIKDILSGSIPSSLTLDFLSNYSKADSYILQTIKSTQDSRSSVCHSALLFTNAIMHGGTAIDSFLRDNLEWLALATSWAKFSATSCLGVIHARHTASALNLLSPYLATQGGASSAYSEGGALYALGLMFANGGSQKLQRPESATPADGSGTSEAVTASEYLLAALRRESGNEVVQHGACLGLGLAAMGSWDGVDDNDIYEELKLTLFRDSAVAGEAAGLAMGLVSIGNGSEKALEEMLTYAEETEHEKIIRGLALGMALTCYGREDDAEEIIETMSSSKEPILRYGAMYAVAMAYCGTADNKAIRKLLYTAVTDVSDDVRRAAVICLGFVLFRHPKQVPKIVALSADSCFPHVRYGAAMALGIACAGTGLASASEILERLAADPSDFVRQGALIALAMVYMQHSEARTPKVVEIRKLFEKTIGDMHEDVMTKFGAILAYGIIDSGGRNSSIALTSLSGHRRMTAVVGLALFTQYWYWFPMVHFFGLALRPTSFVALNKDLKLPVLEVQCNTRPSLFAYPPMGPPKKVKAEEKAPVAVLSVTAKALARESRKEKEKAKAAASASGVEGETPEKETKPDDMEIDAVTKSENEKETPSKAEATKEEPTSFMISNPSRILDEQAKSVIWPKEARYQPVRTDGVRGFILVKDTRLDEEEKFVELNSLATARAPPESGSSVETSVQVSSAANEQAGLDEGSEPEAPEPFEYVDEEPADGEN